MLKRIIRILTILITMAIVFGIVLTCNESKAATETINGIVKNNRLYCINYGYSFHMGKYYIFDSGIIEDIADEELRNKYRMLSYMVYERIDNKDYKVMDGEYKDPISNAVWMLIGDKTEEQIKRDILKVHKNISAAEVERILKSSKEWIEKARAALEINKDGNNLIIKEQPDSFTIDANGNAKLGPFKLSYPQYNGSMCGGELTITVNGNKVEKDTIGEKEFYFTEEDGIKYGEENAITFSYKAFYYTGEYTKYTPITDYTLATICPECGAMHKTKLYKDTYYAYGQFNSDKTQYCSSIQDIDQGTHEDGCRYKSSNYWGNTWKTTLVSSFNKENAIDYVEGYDGYQDLIRIKPQAIEVNEKITLNYNVEKPELEIDISKVDENGDKISGAEFEITVNGGTINGKTTITSNKNSANTIKITPNKTASEVTVTLKETKAPNGYIGITNPIEIKYKWDEKNNKWLKLTESFVLATGEKITNEQLGNSEITYVSRKTIFDPYGWIVYVPANNNSLEITERHLIEEVKSGRDWTSYKNKEIALVGGAWTWLDKDYGYKETSTDSTVIRKSRFSVSVENLTASDDIIINLLKTDTNGVKIANKTFNISVEGGKADKKSIKTDATGKAQITIKPTTASKVILTLTEVEDNYHVGMEPIVITFENRAGTWYPVENNEFVTINGTDSEYDLTVQNTAKIDNLKFVKVNANRPGEVLSGVTFRITLNNAKTLSGNQLVTATTDKDGNIEIGELIVIDPSKEIAITLEEISKPSNGLNYNGLDSYKSATIKFKYQEQGFTVDNDLVKGEYDIKNNQVTIEIKNILTTNFSGTVWLDGQTGLKPVQSPNGKKDKTEKGVEGVTVKLVRSDGIVAYTTVTDKNGYYIFKDVPADYSGKFNYYVEFVYDGINYIATTVPNSDSDAKEEGRKEFNEKFETIEKNTAISKKDKKTALEYEYTENSAILKTTNSDGTVKQEFAISAKTGMYNRTTHNIDLGLVRRGVDLAAVTDIASATINLNGKEATYNYSDLNNLNKDAQGNLILSPVEQENVKYNLYLYKSDYNNRIDDYRLPLEEGANADDKLNVKVTYQILLNNQSAEDVTINKIAYYYDTNYTLEGARPELVTINGKTYNKVIMDVNEAFTDSKNQAIRTVTFTMEQATDREVNYGEVIAEAQNWVEIVSYTSKDGFIDADSAPDNFAEHGAEDDTDDAPILQVQIAEKDRELTGYVFEDKLVTADDEYSKGNGTYDDGENKVNDVIVQLIEIKDVKIGRTTKRYEYIWQETVTGSKLVKCLNKDGDAIRTYEVENEAGHYTFNQEVIAGNYILRFIYGDDEYFDVAIDGTPATDTSKANLKKYNGQDYKSTIDVAYDKDNFDSALYTENSSMARDNEARRLEEMAYATSLTSDNAAALYDLSKTWMCADTSLIDITVNVPSKSINFGLAERPAAYLVLEKHITGLKIQDITEATTTLSEYDKNLGFVNLISNSGEGILATSTSKESNTRGEWLVQTEIEKVAGKRIDITYTYRVTNKGIEYIGRALKASRKSYEDIAEEIETLKSNLDNRYKIGTYLGTAYYTGTKGTDDVETEVTFKIEDYISTKNGTKLDTTTDFVANGTATKNIWDYKPTASNEKQATNTLTEVVGVLQSKDNFTLASGETMDLLTLTVYDESIDSTNTDDAYSYRSYAAQLVYPASGAKITTAAGTSVRGMKFSNLFAVQSYVDDLNAVRIGKEFVPEADEFVAETVVITMDTGADKITPIILITSITAGLAVVAVGIVLIKKYIIK